MWPKSSSNMPMNKKQQRYGAVEPESFDFDYNTPMPVDSSSDDSEDGGHMERGRGGPPRNRVIAEVPKSNKKKIIAAVVVVVVLLLGGIVGIVVYIKMKCPNPNDPNAMMNQNAYSPRCMNQMGGAMGMGGMGMGGMGMGGMGMGGMGMGGMGMGGMGMGGMGGAGMAMDPYMQQQYPGLNWTSQMDQGWFNSYNSGLPMQQQQMFSQFAGQQGPYGAQQQYFGQYDQYAYQAMQGGQQPMPFNQWATTAQSPLLGATTQIVQIMSAMYVAKQNAETAEKIKEAAAKKN